ncbi:phosphoribosyltransferase [Rhodococcus sp. WMMA185]|uniref:phosphoribosyltransferase n=1 Tax=Rhodococcus sp. WMMA185 TaxID=679318 RepID=UPI000878ED37|nr:phosphoribosyltransferase family protein [Rhodococcus sp. WMMA185]AOW92022.1 phosphoribosyltransferase [Rhodococcus sp. WMMA185]
MQYTSRADAGRKLAGALEHLRGTDPVVLGLPRGGVPVAFEIAAALSAPLDVVLVRKLGVPWQPELAMGAIGEGNARVINDDVLRLTRTSKAALEKVEAEERRELQRRTQLLRGSKKRTPLKGRTVVLVDDGMATGATMAVACQSVRKLGATRVVVAVPVAAPEAIHRVLVTADEVVCPYTPVDLGGVGNAYDDFHQLTDGEVTDLLGLH